MGTKSVPVRLLAAPRLVNSQRFTLSGGFTRAMLDKEKKCAGIVTYDPAVAPVPPDSQDLNGFPMTGSAVLVDYNYVLMCGHTLDGIFGGLGSAAMANGKVWVVFSNEVTAATVDTSTPQKEPTRPFANLRGDLEVWQGNTCDLDYALVKIEWPANGGSIAGPMPTLPDPAAFHDTELQGQPVLFIGQYSPAPVVPRPGLPTMSTHAAMSPVTNTGVSTSLASCAGPSPPAYAQFSLEVVIGGPSGGGVYGLKGGQVRLVGIFSRSDNQGRKYFLPLDRIYADTATATGSSKPPGTIGDLMRRICVQRWKDGMPKL
jgi:hypothetical protein